MKNLESHDNIVQCHEWFDVQPYIVIVSELCEGGNLHDFIYATTGLIAEDAIWRMLKGMLLGLNHLHKN